MQKKYWKILTISIIITITLSSILSNARYILDEKNKNLVSNQSSIVSGYIDTIDGIKILHINGSFYNMGFQHGLLLKYECLENIRAFLYYAEELGYSYNDLIDIWNKMKDFIPQDYINEMKGLADGIGVSFEKIGAVYVVLDSLGIVNCFGISAWGPSTKSSKLIHARSCDLPFDFKDPVTGKYAHENNVLIIRNPDNGFASLIPSVAVLMNLGGGINEKGIGYGAHLSWSNDQTFNGMPITIRNQIVLDKSSTSNEAIDILKEDKTLGFNYLISDSKVPSGFIVETTSNLTYVGSWNDTNESISPFWSIDHVVRRTNFFINPELAETQRNRYNLGGIIGYLKLNLYAVKSLLIKDNSIYDPDKMFPIWRNYRTMSKEIQKQWGMLDMENIISMLHNVYNGKTDILLFILLKMGEKLDLGSLESWNQWAACPETGDMSVSFSTRNEYASENSEHNFNLYELLDK